MNHTFVLGAQTRNWVQESLLANLCATSRVPEKFSIKLQNFFQASNYRLFRETQFHQLFCEKFFAKITNRSINACCTHSL